MKRRLLSLTMALLVVIALSYNIKAVTFEKEYSDNINRTIVKSGTKTNISNKTISVKIKSKYNLDYIVGLKNTKATFKSSNTKIATVNSTSGVVTFKKSGKVYIHIVGSDNRKYKVRFSVNDALNVKVSIKGQYAAIYKNGKRIKKVPVVTGKPGSTATPKGTYKIAGKTRNTYLDGSTVGYDYYLAVKYWIPIANTGGVGFHDASWRSYKAYGGNYYLWDGSHGCINMRTADAAYFYKHLKKGTVVKIF